MIEEIQECVQDGRVPFGSDSAICRRIKRKHEIDVTREFVRQVRRDLEIAIDKKAL